MERGPRGTATEVEPGAGVLKIICWNINCLTPTVRNMELRHKSFRGFLDHLQLDIACFQEVKLPATRITRDLACIDGFQSFWATSTARPGYSGITTWCRTATAAPRDAAADGLGGDEQPELDTEGRLVLTDHGAFVLLNVYAPNAGDRPERVRLPYKLAFLRALRAKMDELTALGRKVIVVGDLNVAAERRDVHPSLNFDSMYDEEELAVLAGLRTAYIDVWRRLHPDVEGSYTVWEERTSARAFNVGLRIDYVLVSPELLPYVESCEILTAAEIPPKWSDHAAILLTLRVHHTGSPALSPQSQRSEHPDTAATIAAGSGTSSVASRARGEPRVDASHRSFGGAGGDAGLAAADADASSGGSGEGSLPPRLLLSPLPAAPCVLWRDLEARFLDRNQKTIRDMFGRKQPIGLGSRPQTTARSSLATVAVSEPSDSDAAGAGLGRKRVAPADGEEAALPPPPRPAPALRTQNSNTAIMANAGVQRLPSKRQEERAQEQSCDARAGSTGNDTTTDHGAADVGGGCGDREARPKQSRPQDQAGFAGALASASEPDDTGLHQEGDGPAGAPPVMVELGDVTGDGSCGSQQATVDLAGVQPLGLPQGSASASLQQRQLESSRGRLSRKGAPVKGGGATGRGSGAAVVSVSKQKNIQSFFKSKS
ncbi:hypothetical protein VaNZ11_011462 [Volvox africanus]|uniref:DNA-(apurinic or apyrimidinic site) endonuclease n=1 Tax=Volvox africanus TaxID=51714 RepID=A0ABQ5SBK0_9CHLO|nr:hypothetical protein VaNZ11_011462 [Volvox africanus]